MSAKRACLACRVRKVKCISGPTERCERCTTLGLDYCVYKPTKKRGVGKVLRMGEACGRCRARKRKCDAKRPCTACTDANRPLECEYGTIGSQPHLSDHLQWDEPGPSGSKDIIAQEHRIIKEVVQELPVEARVSTIITQSESRGAPPTRALIHSLSRSNRPSRTPPQPRHRTSSAVRTRNPYQVTLPPFSVLSSFVFPKIPPEPHVSLSSLGPERFQLSDAALGDLDMKFRLRTLCRLNKLGIHFSSEKQQALSRGDTSGAVINPYFIYAAQSLGMHFCGGIDDSPAMVRLQAKYAQKSFESLIDIIGGHDWELIAQAALWVVAGSIIVRLDHITRPYIKKTCDAINTAGLQFIPAYGRPPEFSEDLHEKLSILSQIIYFENFLFLTCDGAKPTMTARLENQFRHQLQEVYPVLFSICPLTMRTQTILLVRDTMTILNLRPTDEVGLGIWRQSCDQLVALLDDYSRALLFNLQRFHGLGDKSGAGMIRSSCVNCFAHLAVFCEALGQIKHTPQAELNALCDSALERLGELTQDMRMEEYTRLDLLLGVSWKRALTVFDARLADVPLGYGAKLRRWKKIVAEVHSVFEAKLPEDIPAIIPLWAERADERTEGSRYPDLMVPGMQQQYPWSVIDASTVRMSMYRRYWEGQDSFRYVYLHPPGHSS